jgi:hypothetical protein
MTKEEFIGKIDEWSGHRELLWPALEATKHLKIPVLELGCGFGSTPYLQQYCKENELELLSYDFNKDWADKFGAVYVENWDVAVDWNREYSVALVDESPGEHRKESVQRLARTSRIVVVHDSEPAGWNASDYQVREHFSLYRNWRDLRPDIDGQPWTTALSNFIAVNEF